jgi:two-component system, NarL family, sensor histidine kinase UhpB
MKLRDLRNSVTARLISSSLVSLAVAIVGSVTAEVLQSRARIDAEIRSSTELADMVIGYAMPGVQAAPDTAAAARRLTQDLNHMRHIAVEYVPQGGTQSSWPMNRKPRTEHPPFWFIALFETSSTSKLYPMAVSHSARGAIVVTGYADDEIEEIWYELCGRLLWLTIIALMITGAMVWMARLALRPIEAVANGMDRLSRGEFTVLDDSQVYELRRIGDRFNTLGASLRRAGADNKILIDRMMALQEAEREDIARELHDEIGSALFSLRAELVALHRLSPDGDALTDRIDDMEAIIEDVQWRNGRILAQLRPMALDHLSLTDALRDLVATWNGRMCGICWISEIEDCAEAVYQDGALAIYRVVQECMTNAARHSQARHVKVRLWRTPTTGRLHVEVVDDGIGYPSSLRMGYGLLGASERVRKLGGSLRIGRNQPAGTIASFSLPAIVEDPPGVVSE